MKSKSVRRRQPQGRKPRHVIIGNYSAEPCLMKESGTQFYRCGLLGPTHYDSLDIELNSKNIDVFYQWVAKLREWIKADA